MLKNFYTQKKYIYMLAGFMTVIIIAAVLSVLFKEKSNIGSGGNKNEYKYDTYIESKLADDVKEYISQYIALTESDKNQIADFSVQNYKIILSSDVKEITDQHSEALNNKEKNKLLEYITMDQITESDLDALCNGINSYVWEAVLLVLNGSEAEDLKEDYAEQYNKLKSSLQAQIDDLKNKSIDIHISAKIQGDEKDYKGIAGAFYENFDAVKSEIEDKYNDDINQKLDAAKSEIENKYSDDINQKLDAAKSEMENKYSNDIDQRLDAAKSELSKELEGKYGNIKDGANGKDGVDGENGKDGKTTYMAYAETETGQGFSLTPTEKTKYIGTCITDAKEQPKTASSYNWQLYRTYIITSSTTPEGTVLYIN